MSDITGRKPIKLKDTFNLYTDLRRPMSNDWPFDDKAMDALLRELYDFYHGPDGGAGGSPCTP